jgi:hypothetical protein
MEMEESVSGYKVRGSWDDVVEHGERITRALRDVGADEDPEFEEPFEEWNEWRPKPHEDIDRDLNEKTADQASVGEGEGEAAGKAPEDDVRTAGEKLSESYEKLEDDDTAGAVDRWNESIGYVARAADSAGRKALRSVENAVYRRVMTQLAPYYFDNPLVSANLQQAAATDEDEAFVFEVNVNDDGYKEGVGERLYEYEDTVDRWHVDTEQETEGIEAAEGVEVPETEPDSSPSTN